MGVERQLLVPQMTGWWSYLIEPELAAAMARSWNQGIAEHPRRSYGIVIPSNRRCNRPDGSPSRA